MFCAIMQPEGPIPIHGSSLYDPARSQVMQFSIIVTLHVCIPSSPQPWDSVFILNTYLLPPACYLSHSSRSPWFTSLACSQYVKNKSRSYSLPVGNLFYCHVTTLFVRCWLYSRPHIGTHSLPLMIFLQVRYQHSGPYKPEKLQFPVI